MRTILALGLAVLILACPRICGAGEPGWPAHDAHAHAPAGDHDDGPAHCPDEGGSCICQGAIVAKATGPSHGHSYGLDLALFVATATTPTLGGHAPTSVAATALPCLRPTPTTTHLRC